MGKYKDRGRRLLYWVWRNIKKRCLEPSDKQYAKYGGRGIGVSEDWQTSFQSFYEWAIESGWKEGLQVDRIDNEKGYSPMNCRITTAKKNSNNRRGNRYCLIDGNKLTFAEAAEKLEVNRDRIKVWAKGMGKVPKPINLVFLPISDRP